MAAWLSVVAEWSIHCDGRMALNEIQMGAGNLSRSGASR